MSAGRIFLGAVIAMATGAALGVLFAPDKGSTTRKKLSKRGSRYMSSLKNATGEVVGNLEEKGESVRETVASLTDMAKNRVAR